MNIYYIHTIKHDGTFRVMGDDVPVRYTSYLEMSELLYVTVDAIRKAIPKRKPINGCVISTRMEMGGRINTAQRRYAVYSASGDRMSSEGTDEGSVVEYDLGCTLDVISGMDRMPSKTTLLRLVNDGALRYSPLCDTPETLWYVNELWITRAESFHIPAAINEDDYYIPPPYLPEHKTPRGKIYAIYNRQRLSSVSRKHSEPAYNKHEFYDWCIANGYTKLYDAWVESGFDKNLAPSADRLNNALPYTFDNLQLVTWAVNMKNSHVDATKAVNQYTLTGELVNTYSSTRVAAKQTGVALTALTTVCRKKKTSAGGYLWKYIE